ncbi:WD40 repeat-containing protein [Heterostelium album PN500]|uniref:WD40 repeat-containing protein n=1 Tax=Heterostelium pallidum (strain ATCC 26659 / Pp 5 / PN500) TaxID=670386 RepID=D3AW44_HETP5|nr:WD40 repeat-containing protein [Heterostelium album PN500]EFA86517.1 WD40 repeat-containing protein [Heterostelium album PN500]|eukprot:XP_020438622.1 WD40 repeat-containing protein [Heterostelium album PN500]
MNLRGLSVWNIDMLSPQQAIQSQLMWDSIDINKQIFIDSIVKYSYKMLKIGVCSNIKISNTQSAAYHSIVSSTVIKITENDHHHHHHHQNGSVANPSITLNGGAQQLSSSSSSDQTSFSPQLSNSGVYHHVSTHQSSPSSGGIIVVPSGSGSDSTGGSGSGSGSGTGGSGSSATSNSNQDANQISIGSGSGQSSIQFQTHNGVINGSAISTNSIDSPLFTTPIFTSVCFHPTAPIVYVSVRNEIYSNGPNASPSNTSKILVGFSDEGLIYQWDTESHKLLTIVHPLKQFDNRAVTCRTNSQKMLFYSKANSKDINVVDCQIKGSLPYKLKGHKRPLSSLAHHPTKSILASVSVDGSLKIWETRSQMANHNLEDFVSYENSRNIEHSNNFFLAFEATQGKYMVMTGSSGLTLVYGDITAGGSPEIIANGFICRGNTILSVTHHPQLPIFFVLSVNINGVEELSAWEVNQQMKSVVQSNQVPTYIPSPHNDTLHYLSKYAKPLSTPKLNPIQVIFHPTRNYLTFQWDLAQLGGSLLGIRHINQFIYSINSFDHLQSSFPLVSTVPLPLGFFLTPEHTFNYPPELIFFDGTYLKSYIPLNGVQKRLITNPLIPIGQDELCKPKSFNYNTEFQLVSLIYDSYSTTTQTMLSKYLICDVSGGINQQGDGIDSVILSTKPVQILVLGLDGKLAKIASVTAQGLSSFKSTQLAPRVTSVYKTPLNEGRVVQYFSHDTSSLYFSKNINSSVGIDNYAVDTSRALNLYKNENVLRIEWQSDQHNNSVCAIMTDMRIVITNSRLSIITQTRIPPGHRSDSRYFGSIYWLEWTLIYTTPTNIMYMTMQNNLAPRPIFSISLSPVYLATVLPDRILYGYAGVGVPGRFDTTIHCLSTGLLEPLIAGLLALPSWLSPDKRTIGLYLQNVVSRFDHSRCSRYILDRLRERGFADLAYSLANQMRPCQNKLSSVEKFRLAWQSKQYVDAHRYLTEEYNKASKESDRRQLTKLKEYIRDFGRECMNAGYYQLAKECFVILGESIYLLQISILLNDRDAIQQLKKDAELSNDQVMVAACERFLNKKVSTPPKINPPVIKILPWEPTASINVGVKIGADYLSPMNLNSINRYFPITVSFSNTASSHGTTRHKLRAPDERWPPEDFKHSVALSPPRTLMSLVANKLSTKTHMSSTQTLRRSPSAENITKIKEFSKTTGANTDSDVEFEDFDSGSDSASGADADVDSETEEDLKLVQKTIEDQMKAALESVQSHDDVDSITTDHEDEQSTSSSPPQPNPLTPSSLTPVTSLLNDTHLTP